MTVAPVTGQFIQARHYSVGRKAAVKWLVIHSAEGVTNEVDLGHFFGGSNAPQASSHAGIGQGGGYASYVTYNNTAWTNPPINSASDTLETCGFKAWTRGQWLAHPQMLESTAHWIAWRAAVRGIPIRLISGADAVAGKSGVLDHKRVNDGFHKSDHTDVGSGFPWDIVIPRAQVIAGLKVPPGSPSADRVLREGMSGHDVANVQHGLNLLGNHLTEDGDYGPTTVAVVKIFQANRGITADGVFGTDSWTALRKAIHG